MSQDENPQVTTTHAGYGEGRPRVRVAATGVDGAPNPDGGVEFELTAEHTVIGSDPRADIWVEGVRGVHAEIEHTDRDEYVLIMTGEGRTSSHSNVTLPDGREGHILRTGYQFDVGPHQLTYMREEYADHGRPYGGREGGEFSVQPQQGPRPGGEDTDRELSYEIEEPSGERDLDAEHPE